MPAELTKTELLDRVVDGLVLSGWHPLILDQSHPFYLRAVRGQESTGLIVYAWNMTSGGPATVRPLGEYRIQMTSVTFPLQIFNDRRTLLLGWHEDFKAFAAFDVARHRMSRSRSPSIQVAQQTLQRASIQGMAVQRKGNDEVVVAFTPEQIMNYVLSQQALHRFGRIDEIGLLRTAVTGQQIADEQLVSVPRDRREVLAQVTRWVRDKHFRTRVLAAYRYRCAICQIQLGLTEAAHIIPIGTPGSTDETSNGLAMCVLHHEAYDSALLGVAPNYHIIINEGRLHELAARDLLGGREVVQNLVCSTIHLPTTRNDYPRPDYLREGLRIRGWKTV